jgi:hypothetical protein
MDGLVYRLILAAAFAAAAPLAAQAALPDDPASTSAVKAPRKLQNAVEQSRAAATPGELRPEHPVVPQVQAQVGKVPPPATATPEPPAVGVPKAPPTVAVPHVPPVVASAPPRAAALNERLARCQAMVEERARNECLRRAEGLPPTPR